MAFDSRPRLTRIRYSTLVLAGSIDSAVAMNQARMLHNAIPGARLVVVDGAGHALIWTTTRVPVRHRRIPRCVTARAIRRGTNARFLSDIPAAATVPSRLP
jgi:pimeloyl-ACP methyl ester carboxylesterase